MRYGTHVILLVYATGEVGQGWLQTSTEAVSRMGCSLRKKRTVLGGKTFLYLGGGTTRISSASQRGNCEGDVGTIRKYSELKNYTLVSLT